MNPHFETLRREPGFIALFGISRRRLVSRNRLIIEEGGVPGTLFLLESGLATVCASGPRGVELLLAHVYPGHFFGEMCLFPRIAARSARVRAVSDAAVLEIPYQAFIDLTRRHPSLWLELAGQLAERLRAVNHRLASMPMLHAADRVWQVLVEVARNSGVDEPGSRDRRIRIRREDLGRLAACSREITGMILHDFATDGRLRLDGHAIIVSGAALAAT